MRWGPLVPTRTKLRCVVLDSCKVQVVVPAFCVLIHTVGYSHRAGLRISIGLPVWSREDRPELQTCGRSACGGGWLSRR